MRQLVIRKEKNLNLEARTLIRSRGIWHHMYNYDALRKDDWVGYAHLYLFKCWDESELKNKADVAVYKQLLEIDSKLGTTQSEQLHFCLRYSPRKDLIQV